MGNKYEPDRLRWYIYIFLWTFKKNLSRNEFHVFFVQKWNSVNFRCITVWFNDFVSQNIDMQIKWKEMPLFEQVYRNSHLHMYILIPIISLEQPCKQNWFDIWIALLIMLIIYLFWKCNTVKCFYYWSVTHTYKGICFVRQIILFCL